MINCKKCKKDKDGFVTAKICFECYQNGLDQNLSWICSCGVTNPYSNIICWKCNGSVNALGVKI